MLMMKVGRGSDDDYIQLLIYYIQIIFRGNAYRKFLL
jgi:hypothetical protein